MHAIGEVAADSPSNSGHLPDGTNGNGVDSEVDKELEALRLTLMEEFGDVFTDELGESDRMRGDPVQLDIKGDAAAPYHCWSPATVSVHHEQEARRMVKSMVKAGIIEEVSWSTEWCSCLLYTSPSPRD